MTLSYYLIAALGLLVCSCSFNKKNPESGASAAEERPAAAVEGLSTEAESVRAPTDVCNARLKELIFSSSNFPEQLKTGISAELIPGADDGRYRVRLYDNSGDEDVRSTVGWVIVDVRRKCLLHDTGDAPEGTILQCDEQLFDNYVAACLCPEADSLREEKVAALAAFYRDLPEFSLPFSYTYDFVLNLPRTVELPSHLSSLFENKATGSLDMEHARMAKLPSKGAIKFVILFSSDGRGEGFFLLYSLDDACRVLDYLVMYYACDVEYNGAIENCYLDYTVTADHSIIIEEKLTVGNGETQRKTVHRVSAAGLFEEYRNPEAERLDQAKIALENENPDLLRLFILEKDENDRRQINETVLEAVVRYSTETCSEYFETAVAFAELIAYDPENVDKQLAEYPDLAQFTVGERRKMVAQVVNTLQPLYEKYNPVCSTTPGYGHADKYGLGIVDCFWNICFTDRELLKEIEANGCYGLPELSRLIKKMRRDDRLVDQQTGALEPWRFSPEQYPGEDGAAEE